MPGIWLWSVTIHLTGGLPMGSSRDLNTAKAEFKTAWKALKARNLAGAAGGGLQGLEHSGRRLIRNPAGDTLTWTRRLWSCVCVYRSFLPIG